MFSEGPRRRIRWLLASTTVICAVLSITSACSGDDSPTEAGLFDSSTIHSIDVSFASEDYATMISEFVENESKEWIPAAVTIDGETYLQAGLRLKGNFSLKRLIREKESEDPVTGSMQNWSVRNALELPLLIRLDKFVEDQNHFGETEIVVRANSDPTALNEAVALELLDRIGLASQRFAYTRLSINGSEQILRLVVQNPNGKWTEAELGEGELYKADPFGDYSYRGSTLEPYLEVWDQEVGEENYQPLIDFLEFLGNSDDETFEAELSDRLDIESFARYLAFQELINNFDDIDGPGNNSYLFHNGDGKMTVVAWDHNKAFGIDVRGEEALDPQSSNNVLVRRFRGLDRFEDEYAKALADLTSDMYASGLADDILDRIAGDGDDHEAREGL